MEHTIKSVYISQLFITTMQHLKQPTYEGRRFILAHRSEGSESKTGQVPGIPLLDEVREWQWNWQSMGKPGSQLHKWVQLVFF